MARLINSGNPPGILNIVTMLVRLANQQLVPRGFHIWSTKGHGARYYLERMERGPSGQPPE